MVLRMGRAGGVAGMRQSLWGVGQKVPTSRATISFAAPAAYQVKRLMASALIDFERQAQA